jgi:glycine/D-amino acid oxidase-like deaminating enzyme
VLDVLIVGGGVHGTHLSHALTARGSVARDRLRVIDLHPEPLALWDARTRSVGMRFLRSGAVEHLDLHPFALERYARQPHGREWSLFMQPYSRPSLALFRAHTRDLVDRCGLAALRVQGRALGITQTRGGWRVETERGALEARRVVLATGAGERGLWPAWAEKLREAGAPVAHVFDAGFERERYEPREPDAHTIVAGGGISAAQLAIALAAARPGAVTLLCRHETRVRQFDSDSGWLGPARMDGFAAERCWTARRAMIGAARNRGSMPRDVAGALFGRVEARAVCHLLGDVTGAEWRDGRIALAVDGGRMTLAATSVVLATGFEAGCPGGAWLDPAIEAYGLPRAECGYPLVDGALRWAPGLHVSGPLAELEVGPVSRNIAGARRAAERLLAA